jgi:CubicO group peptidase (beta-lactamase class C family)
MIKTLAAAFLPMPILAGICQAGSLLEEATGAVSQTLCSKHFISGLPPDQVYREHLLPEPGMGIADLVIRYEVDREKREVRTRLAGGFERRSAYREGRGCTLDHEGYPQAAALVASPVSPALLAAIAGPQAVEPATPSLRAAVDAAFDTPGAAAMTKAVVVVHNGRVIGERYAPGYGVETPVLSHSIAKSVVNALIGILVRQGRLAVSDPAPIAWHGSGDAHASITTDQFLRMTAGTGFDEGSGSSIASHIWYNEPDTARAAQAAPLTSTPGTEWGYSSRSYVVLSRIIGDKVGGGPQGVSDFARRELFGPLGMDRVTLEFDAAGTMMGAHAMFGTPRDWARLGLLYLHDGAIGERRILPEGWVRYSTTPSGATGYGAGFWLNNTDAPMPGWRMNWGLPGVPRDAFMARGYLGQYVVVVPSENLVIAKFGVCHDATAQTEHFARLVRAVIASLPNEQRAAR